MYRIDSQYVSQVLSIVEWRYAGMQNVRVSRPMITNKVADELGLRGPTAKLKLLGWILFVRVIQVDAESDASFHMLVANHPHTISRGDHSPNIHQ